MQSILEELEHRIQHQDLLKGFPDGLYAPMRYILQLPAKRVRPLLCVMAYQSVGNELNSQIYDLAISIELFHNFTLIHDDIMDNAALRRGMPTVHQKYDTNTAILAGDAMFAIVYLKIVLSFPSKAKELVEYFSKSALEVCEGQMLDMIMAGSDQVSLDQYLNMIRRKTAVLLGASLAMGAIAGGANHDDVQKFYEIGESMGMAFQLQDDYFDIFPNENFGKTVGGDILENKKTFLLISALHEAIGDDYDDLIYWLKTHNKPNEKIGAVKAIFERVGVADKCKNTAFLYFNRGLQLINELKKVYQLQDLQVFLEQLQNRVK